MIGRSRVIRIFLRKMAKDTDAPGVDEMVFGGEGVGVFRRHVPLIEKGIFIGDASYLFVPTILVMKGRSNFSLTNTTICLQDSTAKMSDEQKSRCQWRRCYKMVTLLHTTPPWILSFCPLRGLGQ